MCTFVRKFLQVVIYSLCDTFPNCVNSQDAHIANMLQMLGVRS